MSAKSFTHIFLSLAFVALTTALATHHHSQNVHSGKVESTCTLCIVASTSAAEGHVPVICFNFEAITPKFIFNPEFVSVKPVLVLKARDPPYSPII